MENLINLWWDLNTTFPGESASVMWKLGYIVDVHNERFSPYSFSRARDHCFLFPEIGRSFHSHYNWLPSLFCGSPDMFCSCFSSILGRATRPPFHFLQATRGGPSFLFPLSSVAVTEVLLWIGGEWTKSLFFSLFLFRSDCSYSSGMLCTKFMDLKLLSAITCCSTWSCSVVFPKCLGFLIILEVFIQNYSSMLFVALPLTHQSLLLSSFLLFSFLITLLTYISSLQIARRSPNYLVGGRSRVRLLTMAAPPKWSSNSSSSP